MTTTTTDPAPGMGTGETCTGGDEDLTHQDCTHPDGATVWLGGDAWAHPALADLLRPVDTVHTYPGNPRRGDQDAITASIRDLGIYKAQITAQTSTSHVLTGNHTYRGLVDLGARLVPVTDLDVDDTRAAAIVERDNHTSDLGGYDDADRLALLEQLDADGALALAGHTGDDLLALRDLLAEPVAPLPVGPNLMERFVVPPFSVLDQRTGLWQDRKRRWLSLGIQSEVGRGDVVEGQVSEKWDRGPARATAYDDQQGLSKIEPNMGRISGNSSPTLGAVQSNLDGVDAARYGRKPRNPADLGQGLQARRDPTTGELTYVPISGGAGVSIFDPVLCELAYRWFSPVGGHVVDPFAGGSVRGIVAAALGRSYTGVELRPEQVTANEVQADVILPTLADGSPRPTWVTGDSRTADLGTGADLVFSCPPYADLEVYSDDPADLSAMSWADFLEAYRLIIARSVDALATDRFAVWVVGEVRAKDGRYRNLVGETVRAFLDAGASYYNEAILVSPAGSLPIRAGKQFTATRKLGKTHQNVLVFCKGDGRAATAACGHVDVEVPEGWDDQ